MDKKEIGKLLDLDKKRSAKIQQLRLDAEQAASKNPKFTDRKSGKKKIRASKSKAPKGETYEITFSLYEKGKNISEIAQVRNLTESTIKGHLAQGIGDGRVAITKLIEQGIIEEIQDQIKKKERNLKVLKDHFQNKYDYGTLKMVLAHLAED